MDTQEQIKNITNFILMVDKDPIYGLLIVYNCVLLDMK